MHNNYNPKGVAFLTLILAGAFAWGGFRELPKQENYEKMTGKVASTTAVSKQGEDKFTIKIWLDGGGDIAYKLAAHVRGSTLGRDELFNGCTVEMLVNKAEIVKPFTGLLGNVTPTTEIASLSANGKVISTWDDHIKNAVDQRQMMKWGAVGALVLGLCVFISQKMALRQQAR